MYRKGRSKGSQTVGTSKHQEKEAIRDGRSVYKLYNFYMHTCKKEEGKGRMKF